MLNLTSLFANPWAIPIYMGSVVIGIIIVVITLREPYDDSMRMRLAFWAVGLFAAGLIPVLHHFSLLAHLPYYALMAVVLGIPLYRVMYHDTYEYSELDAKILGSIATVTMVIYLLYIGNYLGGIARYKNTDLYDHPVIFLYWCPLLFYVIILFIGILVITGIVARFCNPDDDALLIWKYGLFAAALMPILHRYLPSAHIFDYLSVAILFGCTLYFLRNQFSYHRIVKESLYSAATITSILCLLFIGSHSVSIIRQFQELTILGQIGTLMIVICFSVLCWWSKSIINKSNERRQERRRKQMKERENQLEEILITNPSSQSRKAALEELKSVTEDVVFRILKRADALDPAKTSLDGKSLWSLKQDLFKRVRSARYFEEIADHFIDKTLKSEAAKRLNDIRQREAQEEARTELAMLKARGSKFGIGCPFYEGGLCNPGIRGYSATPCSLAKGTYHSCFALPVIISKKQRGY